MASKRKSAKKNLKARHRRARKAFFLCLFLFALLALITRLLVFVPVKMETNAMQPVYQQNDVVFASRLAMLRGDAIARGEDVYAYFAAANGSYVRRVVGMPGDLIDVRDGQRYLVYDGGTKEIALGEAPGLVYGELPEGASAKDIILHIIGKIGVDGELYCAMEFGGSAIEALSVEGRLTIANMAIEAGGKAGLFEVDDKCREYVERRAKRPIREYHPDADATYKQLIKIDASEIVPCVSWPHLPSNTHPVAESRDITIDQAVIGSCTNGRIEDMRAAAEVLRGRVVADNVRCIVIPATQGVWLQCVHEGLMDVFINAHCVVSTPTCGPCLGGYMGILAAGERCVSSTNRNFVGRMGDPTSEVYLASPAVCAASAVAGHIALPSDLD